MISNPTQLNGLIDAYLSECKFTKRLRPKTIESYQHAFNIFLKMMPELESTENLHPNVLNEFFKRLSTRKRIVGKQLVVENIKASTIRTYYNRLIAFFSWLENSGHIEKYSLTEFITKPPAPLYDDERALSVDEVSRILAAATLHNIDDSFVYKRDIAILSLLLYTGLRKGELLGLRVQDIDFQKGGIFINGATSKSKKSRVIPMHYLLENHLKTYLKERKIRKSQCDALIISSKRDTALTEHGLKHWVNRYVKLSGVKFHLHRFRHTFACSLAKSNADIITIMNVMGHSTIRMTERYLRSIKSEGSRSYIQKMSF